MIGPGPINGTAIPHRIIFTATILADLVFGQTIGKAPQEHQHDYSPTRRYELEYCELRFAETKKATRQHGQPFLSRENSSNGGGSSVKTFWRNLMSRKSGVSRNFWRINIFVFSHLRDASTGVRNASL